MSSPPSDPRFTREERKPITLLKLSEKRALAAAGERQAEIVRAAAAAALRAAGVEPEYLALVDPDTFQEPGPLIVVAAWLGDTRLIDNVLIERAATPERRGADPKGAVSVLPTP